MTVLLYAMFSPEANRQLWINAIKTIDIFDDVDFIEYHVDAITGGTDALIDVIIKLQKGDRILSARGTEPDIIDASVKAYISGVNRLLNE